jgi:hypothetical protein
LIHTVWIRNTLNYHLIRPQPCSALVDKNLKWFKPAITKHQLQVC